MTPPGEIESLERFIRSCLGKLDRTPELHRYNVRELLEEIAYRRRGVTIGVVTMVELVAASERLDWPPELGDAQRREIITRLIGGSGILVAEDGDFRFACQTVQEYLAAYHIVRRHPRGPCWWQPRTREYLAPRTSWPWPDAGVMLFLAALWWPKARPAVERRLRRLLRDRDRDANIDFVIELILRDLIPGSDIRKRTVDLLHRELADDRQDEGRWVATAKWLHLLDPAELEKVIQYPVPTITPHRRFTAVELMKHDPARHAKNLEFLANTLKRTGTPQEWLDTADLIDKRDRVLGERTMRLLAEMHEMGELRVDVAIRVKDPLLLCELIERECALSDDGKLRLSHELYGQNWMEPCGQNWIMAVAAIERFAQTARKDGTPLQIAKMIQPYDQPVALRIAKAVVWQTNRKIGSWERASAVIWIGEIEPAQPIVPELDRLSKAPDMTGEVRLHVAKLIFTKYGGSITAVVDLGDNPELHHTYRIEAAEFVGEHKPVTGARLYISIAKTCTLTDPHQLTLLSEAYKLDPGPAADALAEFALNKRIPGRIRLDAVKIAGPKLDRQRTIDLYTNIATNTDNKAALAAARKVVEMDRDAGEPLMGKLADRRNADIELRLPAALEAGTHGRQALKDLMSTAQPDTVRFKVARALWDIDRKKEAKPVLQELVNKRGAGKVRIDAAPHPARGSGRADRHQRGPSREGYHPLRRCGESRGERQEKRPAGAAQPCQCSEDFRGDPRESATAPEQMTSPHRRKLAS